MNDRQEASIALYEHELRSAVWMYRSGRPAADLIVARPFGDAVPRWYKHFEVHRDGTCEAGVSIDSPNHARYTCPYPPGSVVWVKEPWAPVEPAFDHEPADEIEGVRILYKADDPRAVVSLDAWRPAAEMTARMARLWFGVAAVHVMRLRVLDDRGVPSAAPGAANRHVGLAFFRKLYGNGFVDGDPLLWVYELRPTLRPTT